MTMSVRRKTSGSIAEINVTPMADVMIVLLIIFMLTTQIISGPRVRLPEATNDDLKDETPLVVCVKADRTVQVGDALIDGRAAVEAIVRSWIDASTPGSHEILVQADALVPNSQVMDVIEACRRAGVERIGLQTTKKIGTGLRASL